MKMVALDIGDVWTGIAISDALGITARPYSTIKAEQLEDSLHTLFKEEKISTVVVGYPKTMRGTESDQTRKVLVVYEKLKATFPQYTWILWDERLSSKRAAHMIKPRTKDQKLTVHAYAAASILETYLQYRAIQENV